MKITVNQLRRIIKEEVGRSLKESMRSVEDVYDELRGFCGDDYHEMPVDQVAQEIGMDVEELKAMLDSDEFYNYMSDVDYSRPIYWDSDTNMVGFSDPMSN